MRRTPRARADDNGPARTPSTGSPGTGATTWSTASDCGSSRRTTGAFVGDCGLTVQDVEGEPCVEVGYHVHLALRGQGLATEAAEAVRDTARDAGVSHLVAIIRPENLPSQRVAQKIGLSLERRVFKNGGDALVFGADL